MSKKYKREIKKVLAESMKKVNKERLREAIKKLLSKDKSINFGHVSEIQKFVGEDFRVYEKIVDIVGISK